MCLELTYPEEGTGISVKYLDHLFTEIEDVDKNDNRLNTFGAVLALPSHRLPGSDHGGT